MLGEELLVHAQRLQNALYVLQAHNALGYLALFKGDFVQAHHHCQQGLSLYDAQHDETPSALYGEPPKTQLLAWHGTGPCGI